MWHCPHCGAPQAETARCWVCRKSSTTCSTCRHFRTSLAADVGYCAKDRWRTPLTGRELRACWEEGGRAGAVPPAIAGDSVGAPDGEAVPRRAVAVAHGGGGPLDRPNPMRLRGFVPVEELTLEPPSATASAASSEAPATGAPEVRRKAAPDRRAPKLPPRAVARRLLPDGADEWEKRVSLFGETDL
jgi:hypothetical protein